KLLPNHQHIKKTVKFLIHPRYHVIDALFLLLFSQTKSINLLVNNQFTKNPEIAGKLPDPYKQDALVIYIKP
ncbi:MAG: hypothetical protein AB2653_11660, partial [Candidatus Thiodiazotropha endolucinida]